MSKLKFTLVLLVCVVFSVSSKAQIATHVDSVNCSGHVNFLTYLAPGSYPGWQLQIYFGDGQTGMYTVSQTSFATHTYSINSSVYTVKRVLINASQQRVDSLITNITVYACRFIALTIYHDLNANCIKDLGENIPYPYQMNYNILVDSNGTNVATLPAGTPYYKALGYVAAVYTFTLSPVPGYSLACPTNGIVTVNVPANAAFTGQANWGLSCNSDFDLAVTANSHYKNNGTTPYSNTYITASNLACLSTNAVVTLYFSPKYNYMSASPAPSSVNGHTITWNISNLTDMNPQSLHVDYTPIPGLQLGDTVHTRVTITPLAGDVNIANNEVNTVTPIVTSWDPNNKTVAPMGDIAPGTTLTYTINFENTGTIPAENIHIMDTLSNYLDPASIKLINSSHAVKMFSTFLPGGSQELKFEMDHINLPDISNPAGNKGFVTFQAKPWASAASGVIINNSAAIYFDYNPAVITNTATNTINRDLFVSQTMLQSSALYPNPVSDKLIVRNTDNSFQLLQIVSTTGQTVIRKNIADGTTTVDVSLLVPGLYYVVLNGKAGTRTEKIEKN